jgi:hypothetical protein
MWDNIYLSFLPLSYAGGQVPDSTCGLTEHLIVASHSSVKILHTHRQLPKLIFKITLLPEIKTLIILKVISRTTFTQIKHPLTIGIMQTTITCLIRGLMHRRF